MTKEKANSYLYMFSLLKEVFLVSLFIPAF